MDAVKEEEKAATPKTSKRWVDLRNLSGWVRTRHMAGLCHWAATALVSIELSSESGSV